MPSVFDPPGGRGIIRRGGRSVLPDGASGDTPVTRDTTKSRDTLPEWWAIVPGGRTVNLGNLRVPGTGAIRPDQYLPLGFGKVVVQGAPLWWSGYPGSEAIHQVGIWAFLEGEIEAIDTFKLNGTTLTTQSFPGGGSITVAKYTGAPGDPVPAVWPGPTYNTSGFVRVSYVRLDIQGVASGYVIPWQDIVPFLGTDKTVEATATCRALKVYDPRDVAQDPDDPTTWLHSYNNALHVRYLWAVVAGLTPAEFDDGSISDAADVCDAAGFKSNIAFSTKTDLRNAVAAILLACNGRVVPSGGKLGIYIDSANAGAPALTLSEEDGTLSEISYEWLDAESRATRLSVAFPNELAHSDRFDVTPPVEDPGVAPGDVPLVESTVEVEACTTLAQAVILRDYLYNSQAINLRLKARAAWGGILLDTGTKIRIVTLDGVDAFFLVEQASADAAGFFPFVAKPYAAAVYGSTPITQPPPIIIEPPDPYAVPPDLTITGVGPTDGSSWSGSAPEGPGYEVLGDPADEEILIFPLITFQVPTTFPYPLVRIRIRGFQGPGYSTKTWADMTLEQTFSIVGNLPPPNGTDFELHFDKFWVTRLYLIAGLLGGRSQAQQGTDSRLIIRTESEAGQLSAGVVLDVSTVDALPTAGDNAGELKTYVLKLVQEVDPPGISVSDAGEAWAKYDAAGNLVASKNGGPWEGLGGGGGAGITARTSGPTTDPPTSVTGTSRTDIPDCIIAAFTPTASGLHMILAAFDVVTTTVGNQFVGELLVDGTPEDIKAIWAGPSVSQRGTIFQGWTLSLAAGTNYELKLTGRVNGGTGVYDVLPGHTGFIVVGPGTGTGGGGGGGVIAEEANETADDSRTVFTFDSAIGIADRMEVDGRFVHRGVITDEPYWTVTAPAEATFVNLNPHMSVFLWRIT